MVARHVAVRLMAAVLVICSATALPLPLQAVPVQLSTTTDNAIFTVMRDNLIFLPPDQQLYIAKQLWRESTSSTTVFASLQVYNPDSAQGLLTTVNPRQFITRDGGTQPKDFSPNDEFKEFNREIRLFQILKCGSGQGPAPVAFYSKQGSETKILSTQVDDASQLLRLSLISKNDGISCTSANLKIQEFPAVLKKSGNPHPEPRLGSVGPSIDNTTVLVQMVADYGDKHFVVGVRKTKFGNNFELHFLPYRAKSCKTATAFYYKGYDEYHVRDEDGTLVRRPAFTLQHAATRMYVTSDVLDDMTLNTAGSGVTLKHELEFDTEPSQFPDYRFFSRYDDQALNFRQNNKPLKRNTDYYNRTVHIYCAVHHRKYCLLPAQSGLLQHVAASPEDQCRYPRLADPSSGFFDFLERLDGSTIIPTFTFMPI